MLVGYVDYIGKDLIQGWAADGQAINSPIDVQISVNGFAWAKVRANLLRPDLQAAGTLGSGNHGFRYEFVPPLSPDLTYQISVSFDDTQVAIANGKRTLGSSDQNRKLNPILVTAAGRSGTTLLMSRLSHSPHVIAGELYPFELRLLSYYATAYTTLTAKGDHKRSTHPDAIEGNGTSLGWNPFFHDDFKYTFNSPALFDAFFENYVASKMATSFQDIINSFYLSLAIEKKKTDVVFFAEKSNNLHPWPRSFSRLLFDSVKEIVLLRDPRDLYCSHLKYFNSDPLAALDQVCMACNDLLSIRKSSTGDMVFLKYEGIATNAPETYDQLSKFLGVEISRSNESGREGHLFKEHGTSASPQASIGRWRLELGTEQINRLERDCAEFLHSFSYEK